MKFELHRHELSVLLGQLKALKSVPLRAQRKEIMALAEVALPKGAANQLFLAIGCGGEMSQTGAAQSVLDQALPNALYNIQSGNSRDGKVYNAEVVVFVEGEHYEASFKASSAGLALITATVELLGQMAGNQVVDLPYIPLRAGGPRVP